MGIFPYIGLIYIYIGLIYGRYLRFRFLLHGHWLYVLQTMGLSIGVSCRISPNAILGIFPSYSYHVRLYPINIAFKLVLLSIDGLVWYIIYLRVGFPGKPQSTQQVGKGHRYESGEMTRIHTPERRPHHLARFSSGPSFKPFGDSRIPPIDHSCSELAMICPDERPMHDCEISLITDLKSWTSKNTTKPWGAISGETEYFTSTLE